MARIINYKILTLFIFIGIYTANGLYEFPKVPVNIPENINNNLLQITEEKYKQAVDLGVESINRQERLEETLVSYKIHVINGSISHAQLLEGLPNEDNENYNSVATKILKSSLYVLNSECTKYTLDDNQCAEFISKIDLPQSQLREECLKINKNLKEDYHLYRRLLSPNYKDGLQEIFTEPLPKPREISIGIFEDQKLTDSIDVVDTKRNIILAQWAQFIEHDLSQSVVTTMKDGTPIECCNEDFYLLKPRYIHPGCAPLEGIPPSNPFRKISCLNYVRSTIGVNPECKFGPAQQVNQATSNLDLSQLYGVSESTKNSMRSFRNGQLKVSSNSQYPENPLLPLAEDKQKFCVTSRNSLETCFMAGDSRVNSNPFMIIIYTIFLRSHNIIANKLEKENPTWNDEQLYNEAKILNIEFYHRIVFEEWLPAVLGDKIAFNINTEQFQEDSNRIDGGVSNEFAVAAIRFYLSMLPNTLFESDIDSDEIQDNFLDTNTSKISKSQIFSISKEFYKSKIISNPERFNQAIAAMITQRAMKMDANYAECFIKNFLQTEVSLSKTSGTDALALDVQKGRDHGVNKYIRYLEICANTKINKWDDLEAYINGKDLKRLIKIYDSVDDIDLIVGGISESPVRDSILGPTFTCILGEQFSNIRRFEKTSSHNLSVNNLNMQFLKASQLLCSTTSLMSVPENIFYIPSETNHLVSCSKLRV